MTLVFLIGRLIVGGYFIFSAFHHFADAGTMVQFAASKGVPFPALAITASGLLILFGGASILLGWRPELGIAAIVLFLVGVSIPMHNFWAETGPERMNDFVNFTKNIALAGATLMFVAVPRPWPISVERPHAIGA